MIKITGDNINTVVNVGKLRDMLEYFSDNDFIYFENNLMHIYNDEDYDKGKYQGMISLIRDEIEIPPKF